MISNFLNDFYSEKAGEQLSQEKMNTILDYYGNDYDSLINDLYDKYDTGNINVDKLNLIKDTYGLNTQQQVGQPESISEEVEKLNIQEPKEDKSDLIKSKETNFDKGIFKMAEREAYDKYKETGEIDLNLIPKEEDKPGFIEDKLARLARGIASTGKGFEEAKTALFLTGADIAMDIFKPELSNEQKLESLKSLKKLRYTMPGSVLPGYESVIESLGEHVKEYDSESIADDIANGNYAQAADRAIGGVFESAPSLVLAYLGPGGLISLGTSAAGNKFDEEFEENPEEGVKRLFLNSALSGTAEASFELVTRGILGRATGLIKSGNKKAAKELIDSYGNKLLKRIATDPLAEGASEAATEFTVDLIDLATLKSAGDIDQVLESDFYKKNWKKWTDAGIIGTVTGGGIVTTGALKNNDKAVRDAAEYTLTPESDKKIISDAAIQINLLNEQIKKANSKEEVSGIEDLISEQEQKIIDTRQKVSEELNMMNPDELKKYAEGADNVAKEKRKLNSIFSPILKTKTQEQIDELQYQNDQILRESVDRRLDENIKTVGVEDLGRTVNDYNTKEDYQKAYDNTEFGKKNSMNVTSSDGFIDTEGDIYINKEVAQKVRNVNVAAHELLHGILNNNIKEPGQLKRLVNEFKAILPRKTADLIQKRIDDNYRFITDEQGNRVEIPESEYMEEYFTAFADLIGNKKIKFNENIFTKVGEKITPIFKGKGYGSIKFETGKDVYDFIKSYQKQIAKGELKPETIEAARKVAEQDIDTKFSKTEEDRKIKDIFDEFTGPAENRKFKSKEEFKNSPEYFNALLEIEQSNTLDASIRNTVSQAYLNMNPDFVQEVKQRISDKYQSEYDASKNSLFGWLTGKNVAGQTIIQLSAGDIQTKKGKQPTTVSTSKKIGGEDSKTTIAETLVSDEISPEDYADMKLAQDKLKKIKPQQSRIANKINLTDNEINLAKRDVINFLRKTDRPSMTDPKKFFKAFVDYTTGSGVQPGGFAKVIYDKLSLPKDGSLSTKNRKAFIESIAEDLIALNKVDPAVMRRSKWTPFYELEIKNMNPTQMQKAIDDGRIPSTSNLKSGLDLFKTLNPSVDQVVDYLMGIRPDVLKRKMPKFLGEVIVKNEFNEIVDNTTQPVYDTKGNKTDNTVDLSKSVTQEEVTRGAPQVREKIARPKGVKFSNSVEEIIQVSPDFEGDVKNVDNLLKNTIGEGIYRHETKESIDNFFTDVENIWVPNLPKNLITATVLRPSNRILKNKGKTEIIVDGKKTTTDDYFKIKRQEFLNKDLKYGKEFTGNGSKYKYGVTYGKYFGTTPKEISNSNKSGKIKQINDTHSSMHEQLWKRVNKSIRSNPKNAKVWGNYFSLVGIDVTHPHRMGAEMIGWSTNPKGYDGKLYEWEHAMPATRAYLYLLQASLMPDISFNTSYDLVMNNFKLIALDNYDDKVKLKGSGRTTSMGEGWSLLDDSWLKRYFDDPVSNIQGGINPSSIMGLNNKTFTKEFNIDASGNTINNNLINSIEKAKNDNIKNLSNKVASFSKSMSNDEVLSFAATLDNSLANARKLDAPVKKIRVFDFDDTLAQTKSIVFYTNTDGTEGQLTAEEFAEKGADLVAQGAVMDFSDFNIVRDGKRGPLFNVAKKIKDARGNEDLFVLTARAPESADAIYEFLKSEGLEFKRENIIGLGNSTGAAKANWIVGKAAEGYNDFYFADDAFGNVQAVQDVLDQIDVKSKVQQAKVKFSKSINEDFNKIIEQKTGIASEKRYSKAKAKVRGAGKGNKKFFIPYSAEDFMGLTYPLLSKGKLGDSQMAWFKEHLLNPYGRAIENLSRDRIQMMQDFRELKKSLEVPKDLRKKNDSGFTNEQAVRVYLFNKMGHDIPGLSKSDLSELVDVINADGKLKAFADQILSVTKGDGYVKPSQEWLSGTITTDLIDLLNTTKRRKYLEQSGYLDNANEIFSEENLNKLEAAYGANYREAVENILARMKSGKNRMFSGSRLSNRVLDYINGSIGTIMFFNTRSAVLQTISSINFLNWSFNNPIRAGKAFANQKQYWKDFKMLMNSDYLTDRRNGLKLNISENEIANAAATAKNRARGAMNYILQKGYLPTQFADSFAIASGGATFYRNRVNDLVKQGLDIKEAEQQALSEWKETAEISQQSSDPSKISQQQASDLGRVILAFANTPMQYARIQKRAAQDLINRRGDAKANVSKIIYYGVVQNLIFNALQQAIFAIGFGDDDDEKNEKKYFNTANGMLDSLLRGVGIAGATTAVIKNFLLDVYERSGRKRPEYVDAVYKLLQLSPPISSKISKIRQAAYQFDSKKRRQEVFDKGFSIDNPAYEAAAKVISATTNLPLDRLINKANNIEAAVGEDAETWQRVAMLAGWPEWQIMPKVNKSKNEFVKGFKPSKKDMSNYNVMKKLNKSEQEEILRNKGYSDYEIRYMKKEDDRIKAIMKRNK